MTRAVKDITAPVYKKMIESIDLMKIQCPACGHHGFTIHGYYSRFVLNDESKDELLICRIKCPVCGKTHAILPSLLIPHNRIKLSDAVQIITAADQEELKRFLDEHYLISIEAVRRLKEAFRKVWKAMIASEGITIDDQISRQCVSVFKKQFLQISCHQCFSYP